MDEDNVQVGKQEETRALNVPQDGELEGLAIGRSLGIDSFKELKKFAKETKQLTDWARMKGAKDIPDMIWQVKQLASRIGGPSIGTHTIQNLSTYAYLEMERNRIEKQMKEFEV